MKKKITTSVIFVVLLTFLMACEQTPSNNIPTFDGPIIDSLTAVSDCAVPTLEGGWVCIWADEFTGDEIDETKWNFMIDGQGGGNNELQYYRRQNASIVDDTLHITALKEEFFGRQYTSARLDSRLKGDFRYVRVVVSAKMPSGIGTWPAIWMMPTHSRYGAWPNSGEIDIMEYVGYDPNRVHSTIHTQLFNHKLNTQIGSSTVVENAETEFHTYELIWEPGRLRSFVNENQYFQVSYNPAFRTNVPYTQVHPFDQEFYIVLNLAIGGDWGGSRGVDDTIFPAVMEIDYVRVYQLDYAKVDQEHPSTPTNLRLSNLANTIFWTPSEDDFGVEKYAVYVDGEFNRYANLSQVTLFRLTRGQTYEIRVRAVDFVGRQSALSEPIKVTYN